MESYVRAAMLNTPDVWFRGDSHDLLRQDAPLDVGFVVYFGKTYNIRLHNDTAGNSGLLFYTQHQDYCPTEKTVMQQILEALAQMKPKYIILPGLGGMPAPAL